MLSLRYRLCGLVVGLALGGWVTACDVSPNPSLFDAEDVAASDAPTINPDLPETDLLLRVATYNVHQLFDDHCDSGDCGTWDFEKKRSQGGFEERVARVADSIRQIDADIVLLQEVENQRCLDALYEQLSDRFSVARIGEIGAPASIDVAIMAKGSLIEVRTHRNKDIQLPQGGFTTFSRELLELHLDVFGWRVVVFDGHFKSKTNDDPDRRLAEAMATQIIVRDTAREFPDALVIFGGDLNDTPGSFPLQAMEEGGFLQRVASDIPDGGDWTYLYGEEKKALDHLFVATESRGHYEPASSLVLRDPGQSGLGSSDHAALRAVFSLSNQVQ